MTLICIPFKRKVSAVPSKPATVTRLFSDVPERDLIIPGSCPSGRRGPVVARSAKAHGGSNPSLPTKCCIGHRQSGYKLHRHFLACRPLCERCVSRHRAFLRDQEAGRK